MGVPRILVVEDVDDMREILVETLNEEDYEVHGAASGAEGLELATGMDFHLVITDVRMAGMDGLETIAALRKINPHLPAVIITGYASDDAPLRALELEAADYIYKPFSIHELMRVVDRVLNPERDREKLSLLETLAGGYKKLVESVQLSALEKERERCLQAFYTAIRSRKLDQVSALKVWDSFEAMERKRHVLKGQGELLAQRGEVMEGYQYVRDLVNACTRQNVGVYPDRAPGQVSRPAFMELYKRIQQGTVDHRKLALAAVLRWLEPEMVQRNEDLSALYAELWG